MIALAAVVGYVTENTWVNCKWSCVRKVLVKLGGMLLIGLFERWGIYELNAAVFRAICDAKSAKKSSKQLEKGLTLKSYFYIKNRSANDCKTTYNNYKV